MDTLKSNFQYRVVRTLLVHRVPAAGGEEMSIPVGAIIGVHSSKDDNSLRFLSYNRETFVCDAKLLFSSVTPT